MSKLAAKALGIDWNALDLTCSLQIMTSAQFRIIRSHLILEESADLFPSILKPFSFNYQEWLLSSYFHVFF